MKNISLALFSCALALSLQPIVQNQLALAEIIKEEQVVVLPSSTSYVMVDPITGTVRGTYDPNVTLTETTRLTGGIVIDQATGKIVASLDPSGKTISLLSAPAYDPLVTSIDSRCGELNRKISEAAAAGLISATQESLYKGDLDKITQRELVDKQAGGLTYNEALSLAVALNNLADRLVYVTHGETFTPLVSSRFISADGQLTMVMNDIDFRLLSLRQKVDDQYSVGRLSNTQVADLKTMLDNVAALESKSKKKGVLSDSKKQAISEKLDKVQNQMDKDVAIIDSKRSKIGIKVQ
jgi:hypothetical protein